MALKRATRLTRARHQPLPPQARGAAGPYLQRSLQIVELRLKLLYDHHLHDDEADRLRTILAASDAHAPIWGELMQVSYLENAREGLLTTLQALRQPHGRSH